MPWISYLAALGLSGCVSGPEFAEESLIDRPRVLAVVAEPPEVAPGEGSTLSLLTAGFGDGPLDITWTACGAFATMVGGAQFGDQDTEAGCGGELSVPLGEGTRATLPAVATAALFENLDVIQSLLGGALPVELAELVRDEIGVALTVEVQIRDGERVYRATKKVIVNRAAQHGNPPLPRFEIDGTEVRGTDNEPFECAPSTGVVAVPTGEEVELAPYVPTQEGEAVEEPWLESYRVLTLQGAVEDREERAFYSWFSDAGEMAEGITKSPLRNNLWRSPDEAGCYRLWLVVRDGHGGTSACSLPIAVGDTEACDDA